MNLPNVLLLFLCFIPTVWLLNGSVQKLILVVKGSESKQTLERWVFECECKAKENSQPNTVQ